MGRPVTPPRKPKKDGRPDGLKGLKWSGKQKAWVVGKIIFQTTLGGTYAVWLEGGGGIWCLIEKTATYKNNISL